MNPCALCRCTGSEEPGGYSTVIIRPSLPGMSVRSLDKTSLTFASCAISHGGVRHARHTNSVAIFITNLLGFSLLLLRTKAAFCRTRLSSLAGCSHRSRGGLGEPICEADLTKPGAVTRDQCALVDFDSEVAGGGVCDYISWIVVCAETFADELIETELFWAPYFSDAIYR